ncbi:MAG: hypothetical protein M1827_004506 [Pycnora praestabilis]|nr:MAG: hypothetical protein M1827_004506 [Pycnora praestabilis]
MTVFTEFWLPHCWWLLLVDGFVLWAVAWSRFYAIRGNQSSEINAYVWSSLCSLGTILIIIYHWALIFQGLKTYSHYEFGGIVWQTLRRYVPAWIGWIGIGMILQVLAIRFQMRELKQHFAKPVPAKHRIRCGCGLLLGNQLLLHYAWYFTFLFLNLEMKPRGMTTEEPEPFPMDEAQLRRSLEKLCSGSLPTLLILYLGIHFWIQNAIAILGLTIEVLRAPTLGNIELDCEAQNPESTDFRASEKAVMATEARDEPLLDLREKGEEKQPNHENGAVS